MIWELKLSNLMILIGIRATLLTRHIVKVNWHKLCLIYELQDRLKSAGKTDVKAYACHPGSSNTNLINTSGGGITKFIFNLMKKTSMVQSAELGAYPQLMCATEEKLDENGFYGPTGKRNWTGPVGAHHIEPHAKDKVISKRLWEVSEKETGLEWNI